MGVHPPIDKKKANKDLQDVKSVYDEMGIRFFLTCGTFLGAMREKDFIEWDSDMDIGMYFEDSNRLLELWEKLKEKGFGIYQGPAYNNKLFWFKIHRNEIIDVLIFFKYENKRGYFHGTTHLGYVFWWNDAEHIENLDTIDFKGKEYYVPAPKDEVIRLWYGSDWETPPGANVFSRERRVVLLNKKEYKKIMDKITE